MSAIPVILILTDCNQAKGSGAFQLSHGTFVGASCSTQAVGNELNLNSAWQLTAGRAKLHSLSENSAKSRQLVKIHKDNIKIRDEDFFCAFMALLQKGSDMHRYPPL